MTSVMNIRMQELLRPKSEREHNLLKGRKGEAMEDVVGVSKLAAKAEWTHNLHHRKSTREYCNLHRRFHYPYTHLLDPVNRTTRSVPVECPSN